MDDIDLQKSGPQRLGGVPSCRFPRQRTVDRRHANRWVGVASRAGHIPLVAHDGFDNAEIGARQKGNKVEWLNRDCQSLEADDLPRNALKRNGGEYRNRAGVHGFAKLGEAYSTG